MEGAPETGARGQDKVPAYSWYALGVLSLVYLVNFVDRQILSILANDIKADLGLDDAQLGFLYGTAFAIFYALFGIPLGRLADGWNRTRLLAIGLGLWSCMTALSGFARNGATLALARIGVGVGEATASPCAYSLIADWFPQRLRATALAIYSAGLFLGSGLSLVLGGLIVESWNAAYPEGGPLGLVGWQAAFLAVGLPGLVLAVWVLSLREPVRGAIDGLVSGGNPRAWRDFAGQVLRIVPPFTLIGAARQGVKPLLMNLFAAAFLAVLALGIGRASGNMAQFSFVAVGIYAVFSWAQALRVDDLPTYRLTWGTPAFIAIVLAYGAESFVGYTVTYWAAPYAERVFAFDKADLGWMLGGPAALGGFLGVIGGGWLADRLQMRLASGRLLVVAVAFLLMVPIVLLGYTTADAVTFLVCAFLIQIVTSATLGASAAASQALVLPHMRGTATAIFFLGSTLIGLAFGPFTAGFVSEASGSLAVGVMATLAIVPFGLLMLWIAMRYGPASESTRMDRAAAARPAVIPA
ncbi:MFS family permease [Altererythrobacter atlanticus]|uniref:L-galactonate transporter n=1 Tax=Croceibacterium atlanticum TaxID=1267766 RepID=A0A0F7KST9_9SPHN|nr:MFS transporter [Croceibacterium atlanticum]AKH43473.1 L-galactonate transporter [Croceibacterium atlanticum]MBB5731819.1 MFS family permease [Croceibacterium atlanticum]